MARIAARRKPWRPPLNSLRTQLFLWIALPAAIVLIGVSLLEIRGHEHAMHLLVEDRAASLGQAAAVLISSRITHGYATLADVAEDLDPSSDLPAAPLAHFPAGLTLYAANGAVRTTTPDAFQLAPAQAQYLVQAISPASPTQALTLYDHTRQAWLLVQAVAVTGSPEVLTGAITLDELASPDLMAGLLPSTDIHIWLENDAGVPSISLAGDLAARDFTLRAKTVTVTTAIPDTDWQIVVHESWAELVPPLLRYEGIVFAGVAMVIVVAALSAYFGLHSIVKPLRKLDHAAGQVGWGNYAAVYTPVGGVAEIEDLQFALMRMVDQVRQYQLEMRSYIDGVTLGQEEERKRLARELHDDTVQALIVLKQQIEVAERDLASSPQQSAARLRQLHPLVNDVIAGLRRQIHDLRPLYLEDLGLVTALEMLVRQTVEGQTLVGDLEVVGEPSAPIAPSVELSVFRIAQEALHNVVAHAQATWVHIELIFDPTSLSLRIEDNGAGFDAPRHPHQLSQQGHFGLAGMQERVQLHGGRLQIESEPGKGTVITVQLPAGGASTW